MNKKVHMNAKKAFMDYKLEISGEIGVVDQNKKEVSPQMDFSKEEYTHLGRS